MREDIKTNSYYSSPKARQRFLVVEAGLAEITLNLIATTAAYIGGAHVPLIEREIDDKCAICT